MSKYVIERDIPGIGNSTPDQFLAISQKSCGVLHHLGPRMKAGWLKTEMGPSDRNRPVRIFKVTAAGRKHLEQELASVEKMFAGFNRVLALAGE